MPKKTVDDYSDSIDTSITKRRIKESISLEEVQIAAKELKLGDKVPFQVRVPTIDGDDLYTMRSMVVTVKYKHLFGAYDPVSKRVQYMTYRELVRMRRGAKN